MANIKSAKKRIKVSARKTMENKRRRSDLRTALKKAEYALEHDTDNKVVLVSEAIKKLDRASVKGILHTNNAARKKSQLTRKLNKAS